MEAGPFFHPCFLNWRLRPRAFSRRCARDFVVVLRRAFFAFRDFSKAPRFPTKNCSLFRFIAALPENSFLPVVKTIVRFFFIVQVDGSFFAVSMAGDVSFFFVLPCSASRRPSPFFEIRSRPRVLSLFFRVPCISLFPQLRRSFDRNLRRCLGIFNVPRFAADFLSH